MSLVERSLPAGEPTKTTTTSNTLPSPQSSSYDELIFDEYCEMEQPSTNSSPKRVRPTADAPALPKKSTLRASRIVDNLGLKLGGAVEVTAGATTPHDLYLSSEEDASSDADDFSDYDYDSSVEDPTSPTRRTSHEVTARVVSVVFAGKPSMVDVTMPRRTRSTSPNSMDTSSTRSSTDSAKAPTEATATRISQASAADRPITPASTTSSHSNRKSTFLSDMLTKKRPPFLNIDPYANGSHYSLEVPKALDSLEGENAAMKVPRTPTQLFKGVTRSFSLVRKRSRPTINTSSLSRATEQHAHTASPRDSLSLGRQELVATKECDGEAAAPEAEQQFQQAKTPQTPITYNDILRAVKKNAIMLSPPDEQQVISPGSPGPAKRGILSGLAARRRSVKLTGMKNMAA